ncbi:MAG: isoprenylcysteine carboxylmethyltransferase family protein [Parvibaculum sp.]
MQKLLPPILVAILLILMLVLHVTAPLMIMGGNIYVAAGLTFMGIALLIGGSRTFARVGTNIKTFNDPNKFVTTGLFRVSRNPMYLGFTLLLFGVATWFGSLASYLIALSFFIIANLWYIPFEERKMEKIFGNEYRSYKTRVRRWL